MRWPKLSCSALSSLCPVWLPSYRPHSAAGRCKVSANIQPCLYPVSYVSRLAYHVYNTYIICVRSALVRSTLYYHTLALLQSDQHVDQSRNQQCSTFSSKPTLQCPQVKILLHSLHISRVMRQCPPHVHTILSTSYMLGSSV